MATTGMNHASNPLKGETSVPAGTSKLLAWNGLEDALRRAGEVRPGEQVACFVVADDGVWLVLERIR